MEIRSWYGLIGSIQVEQELWHLVKVGGISLPHPPLINLVLRQRQTHHDRLRLSFLHEFGHLQTLPLALLHLLWLIAVWLTAGRRHRGRGGALTGAVLGACSRTSSLVGSDVGRLCHGEDGQGLLGKIPTRCQVAAAGVLVDHGIVTNGYAWVFPFGECVRVGIGTFALEESYTAVERM